jgi:predicted HTH domain antitoxin
MNTETVKLDKGLAMMINRLAFLGKNLEEKVTVSLAISLFAEKQVSLARAAELSNKPLTEFMDILQKSNIPWCEYTEEIKNADDLAINLILQESEK